MKLAVSVVSRQIIITCVAQRLDLRVGVEAGHTHYLWRNDGSKEPSVFSLLQKLHLPLRINHRGDEVFEFAASHPKSSKLKVQIFFVTEGSLDSAVICFELLVTFVSSGFA